MTEAQRKAKAFADALNAAGKTQAEFAAMSPNSELRKEIDALAAVNLALLDHAEANRIAAAAAAHAAEAMEHEGSAAQLAQRKINDARVPANAPPPSPPLPALKPQGAAAAAGLDQQNALMKQQLPLLQVQADLGDEQAKRDIERINRLMEINRLVALGQQGQPGGITEAQAAPLRRETLLQGEAQDAKQVKADQARIEQGGALPDKIDAANVAAQNLSQTLADIDNLSFDSLKETFRQIAQQIAQMIIQALIFRAIMAATGTPGAPAPAAGGSTANPAAGGGGGGMFGFAKGGVIDRSTDHPGGPRHGAPQADADPAGGRRHGAGAGGGPGGDPAAGAHAGRRPRRQDHRPARPAAGPDHGRRRHAQLRLPRHVAGRRGRRDEPGLRGGQEGRVQGAVAVAHVAAVDRAPGRGQVTVLAWPSGFRGPSEFDFWIDVMESAHGDENPTSSGMMEVVTRFGRVHAQITWPLVTPIQAAVVEAHLNRMRGRRNPTVVPNFKYKTKLGTAAGAWAVSGAHARGAEALAITGGSGAFAAGDWVQVEQVTGVPRAYFVVAAQAGGSIEVAPPLHEAVSSGKALKFLGDNAGTVWVSDTMELLSDVGPAPVSAYGQPPGVVAQRTVEMVSARRGVY